VKAYAAAHPDGPIFGRGWIETHWPEKRFPNRADLDRAAPGRVVVLERADGHASVASTAALAKAG
jgi:predicted amidohydrolase YtcJ